MSCFEIPERATAAAVPAPRCSKERRVIPPMKAPYAQHECAASFDEAHSCQLALADFDGYVRVQTTGSFGLAMSY
jgi:hypothetical protein